MTTPSDPDYVPLPKWIPIGMALFGGYLLLSIAGYAIAGTCGLHAVHVVLFGWLAFLSQRMETFRPDLPTASVGLGAMIVLLLIVQSLGRQLAIGTKYSGRWTWRSTLAATSGVVLLFAGGVAFVGAAHQAIWLAGEDRTKSRQHESAFWPQPGPLNLVGQERLKAVQNQSRNNLKQIMIAMHNVHDTMGTFPPGAIIDDQGHARHGWVFAYATYGAYWVKTDWKSESWDGPQNQLMARSALLEFINPQLGWHGQFDEHGYAYMHYAANVHGFPNNRGLKMSEITDGTSNTLALGEVAENFQPWASPWNRRDPADGINNVPYGFGGPPSQNGAIFAFFDGQVRMISRNVDRELLKSLGLPNDGKPVMEWESQLR